jgi:hypothetical protein
MIGVVVCSILLLPSDRKNSCSILNAQAWIEKKAEWISGESLPVDSMIASANEKKMLLLQARNIIGINQKESDQWVDIAIDFDQILKDIDVSQHRRIARNDKPKSSQENLDKKLSELAAIP